MSKRKKKNKKYKLKVKQSLIINFLKNTTLIVGIPLAILGAIDAYQNISEYFENKKLKTPVLYTSVEVVGEEELPDLETEAKKLKARVTVSNNGQTPISLDPTTNIYVVNYKTKQKSKLKANLVKTSKEKSILSRNPILLAPGETIVYETSYYLFDNWFSFHNQYITHFYSRSVNFISATKKVEYQKAEEMSEIFTTMDGIMRHHFGNLSVPMSEALPIGKKQVINI